MGPSYLTLFLGIHVSVAAELLFRRRGNDDRGGRCGERPPRPLQRDGRDSRAAAAVGGLGVPRLLDPARQRLRPDRASVGESSAYELTPCGLESLHALLLLVGLCTTIVMVVCAFAFFRE
ncbi:unnamed protein product, partial [Prorocentrum cordatum]